MRWLRILAAPALLGAIIWLAGPARVIETVRSADPRWLALGLLMNIAANMIAALRWRELARWFGMTVARLWALITYFHGVAVSAILPGAVVGGDVLRAFALQRLGHPGLDASLSVLLDRLSGLWMLCVIGFLAIAWGADREATRQLVAQWPLLADAPLMQAALLAAGVLLVTPWAAIIALRWWLPGGTGAASPSVPAWNTQGANDHHRPSDILLSSDASNPGTPSVAAPLAAGSSADAHDAAAPPADVPGRLTRLRTAVRGGHAGPHYLAQIILSGIVQLLAIGSLVCAARALHIDIPFWAMAVCTVPILVLATLPISFGGWGTREAAAVLSLGAFGVPAPAAVMISVFYGLYGLVQALGGLVRHRE